MEKYKGWESRDSVLAFGDRIKNWQVINGQNFMVSVDERMNITVIDTGEADRQRTQMDYHMFLAYALATKACHELVADGKIGPAVSSTCTYSLTNKPEDIWSAKMNDAFKTGYCLDMHYYGKYPGYYMKYLEE